MLKQKYPGLKIEDLEVVVESMDRNKDGKIDVDEFITCMHTHPESLQMHANNRQYRAILALKSQRRLLPNDFMNYFERISKSLLYSPSFISSLHSQLKNLPSESFKLVRDDSGIWYQDVKPIIGAEGKPTKYMQQIDPAIGGYIIMNGATGVPIPDETVLKRENIVNRVVKIGFFDNKSQKLVYGTTFLQAEWDPSSEDIWSFNSTGSVGTNPIVFKWADGTLAPSIDLVFEFVSSIKKGAKIVEVSNGWGKIPIKDLATAGNHSIPLSAGTPLHPSEIDQNDVRADRKGFFAGLKKAFGKTIKTQFKISIRPFENLLEGKKQYIQMLPGHCLVNKKLLPFIAQYRQYLGSMILSEQIQQFKRIEQDSVISQFGGIMDNPDIVSELIKYWDIVFQKYRKNEDELSKKCKKFVHHLYWVTKAAAFYPDGCNPNASAKGDEELYNNRLKLISSALTPLCETGEAVKEDISVIQYKHFRIEELKVKRADNALKPSVAPIVQPNALSMIQPNKIVGN